MNILHSGLSVKGQCRPSGIISRIVYVGVQNSVKLCGDLLAGNHSLKMTYV